MLLVLLLLLLDNANLVLLLLPCTLRIIDGVVRLGLGVGVSGVCLVILAVTITGKGALLMCWHRAQHQRDVGSEKEEEKQTDENGDGRQRTRRRAHTVYEAVESTTTRRRVVVVIILLLLLLVLRIEATRYRRRSRRK